MINNEYTKKYFRLLIKNRTTNSDFEWNNEELIPRAYKRLEEQKERTKKKAEVFTPSCICNVMNNYLDMDFFGHIGVFNKEVLNGWITNKDKIDFGDKDWKDYVLSTKLEITCGEAPYLTSRYDTTIGEYIEIEDRIGILDRKLRVINENVNDLEQWNIWVEKAYQSTYGYEYQIDNLLIARINLMMTFIENYKYKWNREPNYNEIYNIIYIITWNIFNMDGLTNNIPHSNTPVIIIDWKEHKKIYFKNIGKE